MIPKSASLHTLTLSASGSHSSLGYQVRSERPTTAGYSFSRYPSGRERSAKVYAGCVVDPLYRGMDFNRHAIPETPAAQYKHVVALGKQQLSKKQNAFKATFGTSSRFGYLDRELKMRKTPGPGEYAS
jgi:hypothetical protein